MIKSATLTQYAVTIGLVPFTMLLFGQVSLVSPFANAVAIPLVSFIVTPLALIGSVLPAPLSGGLLGVAHFCRRVAGARSGLGQRVSCWRYGRRRFRHLDILARARRHAVAACAARLAGTLAWVGGLGSAVRECAGHPGAGEMWVTAFDVGQGTALLVETERHRLLYDTGPFYSPESDGGNRVILPYLKARGIDSLDAVVISHSDNDHSGGALSIFGGSSGGLGIVFAGARQSDRGCGRPRPSPLQSRAECGTGMACDFEMLHPTRGQLRQHQMEAECAQLHAEVSAGGQSVLLPGDIEAAQEAELVAAAPDKLRASVLLAPHHGSGTSSTAPFLNAVKPELALFQVGYRNRYRHPKEEVFDRYEALGITRLRSDDSGAVMVKIGAGVDFKQYRDQHARYWYGR